MEIQLRQEDYVLYKGRFYRVVFFDEKENILELDLLNGKEGLSLEYNSVKPLDISRMVHLK